MLKISVRQPLSSGVATRLTAVQLRGERVRMSLDIRQLFSGEGGRLWCLSAGEMRGWSSAFTPLVRKQISDPGLHCLHGIEPGAVCYPSILGLGAQCPWLTGLDKHLSYLPTWKWGDMISGDWRVAGQWAYLGAETWIGRRGQPRDSQGRAFQDGTTWGGWWA